MANCVTCKARCVYAGLRVVKTDCISYIPKDYPKPITNADRVRAMTEEELAELLNQDCPRVKECTWISGIRKCEKCWLDWLKEEVNDGD